MISMKCGIHVLNHMLGVQAQNMNMILNLFLIFDLIFYVYVFNVLRLCINLYLFLLYSHT